MTKATSKQNRLNRIATRTQKTLLPLVAAGGGLAAAPASAIELGDAIVQSRLGQPLRASIAFALAPNEQLSDSCVSLGLGNAASGLPGIGSATIRVADGTILVSGTTPLREPMVATSVVIDCPYTANLRRDYMLFIDPADLVYDVPAAVAAAPAVAPAATTVTRRAPRSRVSTTVNREPIGESTRYQVQPGDSLSEIVQRIENRGMSLWPAVNALFAANPDAFMDNDPNKLKAGSWLDIPSLDGSAPVVADAAPEQPSAVQSSVYTGVEEVSPVESTTTITTPAEPAISSAVEPVAVTNETMDATGDLRPGDIILQGDSAFVDAGASETIVIPDTELDGPETASSSPNVPTAAIAPTSIAPEAKSSSWMLWLAGGGIAIIFALLLFGGRLRRRLGGSPMATAATAAYGGVADDDTESIDAIADEEYDLDDDSPTAENLALDADLFVGTGLEEGTDMEVAEDFGFASPTEVDIELPFEPEKTVTTMETDILPPVRTDERSILDSEILPDDDDYDMSVIVDATKMPQPEDVTQRDLQAVEVTTADDGEDTDNYTINRETEFNILEQDYEDEFTATQALNQEIARAARELAETMDDGDDATSEMPLATVTELDVTAQLPRQEEEEVADPDNTVENEAITVNMSAEEKTAEMRAAGNDDTIDMEVESGKVDTKTG